MTCMRSRSPTSTRARRNGSSRASQSGSGGAGKSGAAAGMRAVYDELPTAGRTAILVVAGRALDGLGHGAHGVPVGAEERAHGGLGGGAHAGVGVVGVGAQRGDDGGNLVAADDADELDALSGA